MAKTAKKKSGRSKHRASWTGNLTFGLVAFPVQAFNAFNRQESDFHFHQLHAGCHRRIKYQKVCPVHGEISSDEIVSGYEYRKGKYVEMDSEELDALRTDRDRSLTIDTFVEPDALDPLYLDGRMYYLMPAGDAAPEPYAVVAEAMEEEDRYGIGQVVFSGKEQLAMVRALDGLLIMAMLNYDEEIRSPEEMALALKKPRQISRQVKLAQLLIRNWSTKDFDFTDYDDRYREKVKRLIKAKVEGREIVQPAPEQEDGQVINLMEALKQSVAREKEPRQKRTRRSKRRSA